MMTAAAVAVPAWVSLSSSLAPIAAILVFMAPIPTISNIRREHTVGSLPLLPYSTMVSSAWLWTVYGILKQTRQIIIPNSVGLVLALYYFTSFVQNAGASASPTFPGSIKHHIQGSGSLCLGTLMVALSPLPDDIVGNVGVILCMIMFASPLAAVRTVVKTQSAKSIPLPFTLASTVNCFLWSISGWFDLKDPNVYVPNLVALVFSLIQVAVKLYYYGNDMDEKVRNVSSSGSGGFSNLIV